MAGLAGITDFVSSHWKMGLVPFLLAYMIYSKVEWVDFRKRAVEVEGRVLKIVRHSRYISYFLSYAHDGKTRIAEYCGADLLPQFKPGESIRVLIDPVAPPDVPLPQGNFHIAWFGGGGCVLADASWFSIVDFLTLLGCAFLAAEWWRQH